MLKIKHQGKVRKMSVKTNRLLKPEVIETGPAETKIITTSFAIRVHEINEELQSGVKGEARAKLIQERDELMKAIKEQKNEKSQVK